jgi:hypothetical protein
MHDTVFRDISEGGAEAKRIWQGRSLFGLEYFGKAEENTQRSHGYTAGKIELNEEKGRLIFWPRGETRLQGGQREIVSDQSVKLIDEYHTIPREFNLLNSYRSQNNNDKDRQVRQMSQHDIFVSYAHVDNEPLPGVDKGWVTTLINGLKNLLGQKLGRADAYSLWMDDEERGNTEVPPYIIEQIKNAATFLLILSPGYLESKLCRLELSLFLAQVDENSGRVFVVEHNEVERPKSLSDLLGYKFWIKDDTGRTHTLAMPKPHPEEREYYQKLDDLARELSDKIKFFRQAEKKKKAEKENTLPIQKVTPTSHKQTVFLALVSYDLEERRDDIKRYFEQQNVQVLPTKHYSPYDNDPKQQLKQDLKQCNLFVQLLSEKTGLGLPQLQYDFAQDINVPIFQWCASVNLKQVSDIHQTLLSQSTLIVSSLVEFQEHIISLLKSKQETKTESATNNHLVFINRAAEDIAVANEIKAFLKTHHISCCLSSNTSNTSAKPKKIRQDLEKHLLQCHSVILVYDNATEHWVDEQVRYCQRIQVQRTEPFKIIALYKKLDKQQLLFSNEQQLSSWGLSNLNIETLECVTPQDKDCLPKFLQILRT